MELIMKKVKVTYGKGSNGPIIKLDWINRYGIDCVLYVGLDSGMFWDQEPTHGWEPDSDQNGK